MMSSMAVAALENAVRARCPVGTVVHSDCDSQAGFNHFHRFVESLTGSMGRMGACADNAAMESFFSLLQKNIPERQRWGTSSICGSPSRPGSKNLPPTATATTAGETHAYRKRDNQPNRDRGGLKPRVSKIQGSPLL